MGTEIAVDLKVARRQSGLSQTDIAHLLDADRSRISKLEHGRYKPSADEMMKLCVIYDKRFSSLCKTILPEVYLGLSERMKSLSQNDGDTTGRNNSLQALAIRLSASPFKTYE